MGFLKAQSLIFFEEENDEALDKIFDPLFMKATV